jgi:PIN domain nuclease of toxin-antitoxin system
VRLLLDTHAWLWYSLGDQRLTALARSSIEDTDNEKLVSPASLWEISIKISLGKYVLAAPYEDFVWNSLEANGIRLLPIEPRHTAAVISLPFHHRDPFDRPLVAQAIVEQLPIIRADAALDAYGVERLW